MKDGKMVTLVIEDAGYRCSRKMALATINLAKEKFIKEGVSAIVAVEKHGIISLRKDVYDDNEKFHEEIGNWEKGGFKCYYVQVKGKKNE